MVANVIKQFKFISVHYCRIFESRWVWRATCCNSSVRGSACMQGHCTIRMSV